MLFINVLTFNCPPSSLVLIVVVLLRFSGAIVIAVDTNMIAIQSSKAGLCTVRHAQPLFSDRRVRALFTLSVFESEGQYDGGTFKITLLQV